MGAISIPGGLHREGPADVLIRELTFADGSASARVLATRTMPGSHYSHVLYAAVHFVDSTTGDDLIEAVVIQYQTLRRDGSDEFLFRRESEHVGPCERQCPADILALLTALSPPPPAGVHDRHANARAWRAACYANAGLAAKPSVDHPPIPPLLQLLAQPLAS